MENLKFSSDKNNKNVTGSKVIHIGQLRLKRTIFEDPNIVRLYVSKEMYLKLNGYSIHYEATVDELIRDIIEDWFLSIQ